MGGPGGSGVREGGAMSFWVGAEGGGEWWRVEVEGPYSNTVLGSHVEVTRAPRVPLEGSSV